MNRFEIWNKRVTKALKAEKIAEEQAEDDRIEPFINKQNRQIQAFDWVYHWGIPQEIAAKMMGISQPAPLFLFRHYA